MLNQSAIEITSEVHVYRFKVPNAGVDTPQMPTVPGLYGHQSVPSPMITPKSGKVQLGRNGEVRSVEVVGVRVDNGQRDTTIWTPGDLASADYHGIPGHMFVAKVVAAAQAHHRSIITSQGN